MWISLEVDILLIGSLCSSSHTTSSSRGETATKVELESEVDEGSWNQW
jgi:hypothetical protein